jgi:hypothetical protein
MKKLPWGPLAAAAAGLGWFLRIGGLRTLNVADIDWLLDGDWGQHLLGWLFFRNERWTLPLGTLSGALYPIGSTVGYTDSNPLLSVLLKPFSGFLPNEFQFIGPWFAACFMLQGYFGAKLVSTASPSRLLQFLGGCLFALSPTLMNRLGHDTLCAHWLILALLYLHLRPSQDLAAARRSCVWAIVAVGIASSVHPYLAAMTWTLTVALLIKLWRFDSHLKLPEAGGWALGVSALMFGIFALFGYFGGANYGGSGFGDFSADLLTLINPMGSSRLLPTIRSGGLQYEGFGFLGLGAILLSLFAAFAFIKWKVRPERGLRPLIVGCALLGFFALSDVVTLAGYRVLGMRKIYAPFAKVVAPFRSSGRFVWPMHYLVMTAAVLAGVRALRSRPKWAAGVLAAAVAIQAADAAVLFETFPSRGFARLKMDGWELASGRYQHLALYPMQVWDACVEPWEPDFVRRYFFQAYRTRLTFNSGYFARLAIARATQVCKDTKASVESGALDPATIYVVAPTELPHFQKAEAVCAKLEADLICVAKDGDAAFREYLRSRAALTQ